MSAVVYTLHVLLAGVWLGRVVFTTTFVSPALKAMKWGEAERVGVRSVIGHQYARVGTANLALLLVFAVLDGVLGGFGAVLYAEYALLVLLFGLVAAHGAYFGRRLRKLAEAPSVRRPTLGRPVRWLNAGMRCRGSLSGSPCWISSSARSSWCSP